MSIFQAAGPHAEHHGAGRAGWLRAAVLGANDGLVSTASLMVGVAASHASTSTVITAGLAGVAAGSMAMAAGTHPFRPALRVLIGGGLAMAITAAVGQLAHVSGI